MQILKGKNHELEKLTDDTFFSPHGFSLRMGGLGYTSEAQKEISICYNQLATYIETLEKARRTTYPPYSKIGLKNDEGEHLQLNDHLLQIDNEFYSNIRPKNLAKTRESALGSLYNRGIEYIEVRILDVNPFDPLGIDKEQVNFIHLFLSWCLSIDSPKISKEECDRLDFNLDQIVRFGRKETLILNDGTDTTERDELVKKLMGEIETFSKSIRELDSDYELAFTEQNKKIENKDLLLVNRVLNDSKTGFVKSSLEHSRVFHEDFLETPLSDKYDFEELAKASILAEEMERKKDKRSFDDFLKFYFEDIKLPL